MEYARLETALLRDVDDSYYYAASCGSCLHASRLSLMKLRRHLGDDFPLAKIRHKLKCQLCGHRQVIITFLGPHQRTATLVDLFNKTPR
jgi:hypothetical protein